MPSEAIQALMDKYQSSQDWTEKAKAQMEEQLWSLCSKAERKNYHRYEWLLLHLNVEEYRSKDRQLLWNAGSVADPIWERIQSKDMPLHTGARIYTRAKQRALDGGYRVEDVISASLQEYDSLPKVSMQDGTTMRKKVFAKPKTKKQEADYANFWTETKQRIHAFLASKLEGVDPVLVEPLLRDFEGDFKSLVDSFQSRLNRTLKREKSHANFAAMLLSDAEFTSALETLGLDPVKRGQPVDLKAASASKRRLVRLYHPDVNGGEENMRRKYEAVIGAYDLLEKYNESLAPTGSQRGDSNGTV